MVLAIDYNYDGKEGTFELEIPASEELFIEMGDLTLNPAPEAGNLGE